MKIIILNGSSRVNGITATILHRLEYYLLESGVHVSFYNLGIQNISHCTGCCSCYKTGHCHIKDDAELISDDIQKADGIIIGSPTYASNVSGIMKDMIDRGHFVIEQALNGKHCITVATGENYGNADTSKVLNKLVLFSGGYLSSKFIIKASFSNHYAVTDRLDKKCRRSSQRLLYRISNQKQPIFQSIIHVVIFNFGIKPFVKKKGSAYNGVIEKWAKLEIKTGKS